MTEADLDHVALGASLGRAIGSLHRVDTRNLDNAGMPVYTAQHIRQRHRATVKAAHATGKLPARLLTRWEKILDRDQLWNFQPTSVHGDLEPTSFLVVGNAVMGMRDFSRAHVGDPAQDLAWVLATASNEFFDRLLQSYLITVNDVEEGPLVERAQFITEVNLAAWLLSGVADNDTDVIAEATQMLEDLAEQLEDDIDFDNFVPLPSNTNEGTQGEDEPENQSPAVKGVPTPPQGSPEVIKTEPVSADTDSGSRAKPLSDPAEMETDVLPTLPSEDHHA